MSSGLATEDDDGFIRSNRFPAAHMSVHLIAPQIAASQAGSRGTADLLVGTQVDFW